ncbi:unnamed protein product [Bursaphelenchus xylophilus]|uniref:deoxyribose-phosphate aldolase n=1 Tax=Bursaphelenchus xylophilus TaxID=6326 RepID=A0A1I7SV44_BURXY|nr:unnamed protein product [Bursaphelenchus xylophilus]CAG9100878.1 unnamed protein product [Bursaphelenchus xylophilus]
MADFDFTGPVSFPDLEKTVEQAKADAKTSSKEVIRSLVTYIDLTTLAGDDTRKRVQDLAARASKPFPNDPSLKCAAVCVYPARIGDVKEKLAELGEQDVKIASVVGGFPSGQYHLQSRVLECQLAAEDGADELDTVINRAAALEGKWKVVEEEILQMKRAGNGKHLKVILATGELKSVENIYRASLASILGGADFIKTSTGKESVNATLEAAYVMLEVIKEYYEKTGKKIGFKPAGGIRTVQEALEYVYLIKIVLGDEWLTPKLFRIGASSLLDNVLKEL